MLEIFATCGVIAAGWALAMHAIAAADIIIERLFWRRFDQLGPIPQPPADRLVGTTIWNARKSR
jgi:hypothetical protein